MGSLFQFPLSRGFTLWHFYEEQAFWDTFFNSPYQEGVLYGIHMRNRHLGCLFNSSYQEGVLWHYMRNRHFGIPFSIPRSSSCTLRHYMGNRHFGMAFSITPIKSVYSLALLGGTGILEYVFKLPLSRGWTLWHSYEEQAFWDTFSIPPIITVYSGIHMRNRHL